MEGRGKELFNPPSPLIRHRQPGQGENIVQPRPRGLPLLHVCLSAADGRRLATLPGALAAVGAIAAEYDLYTFNSYLAGQGITLEHAFDLSLDHKNLIAERADEIRPFFPCRQLVKHWLARQRDLNQLVVVQHFAENAKNSPFRDVLVAILSTRFDLIKTQWPLGRLNGGVDRLLLPRQPCRSTTGHTG